MTAVTDLEPSLQAVFASTDFQERMAALTNAESRITSTVAQAALSELIRLLAPARVLEIGTYFANTTRVLAETIVASGGGSLTTIDPFGGDRIPAILQSWPEALREVTTFHPLNSMSYFANLESARTPTGANAPFDLVFVDGHHSFEYAFFDIMSAALYLRPGGVIVVDNMEQAGPAAAVEAFLERFTQWRFFVRAGHALTPSLKESLPGSHGAILLAPAGVEVGRIPVKFQLYKIRPTRIESLTLPLSPVDARGSLKVSANLYSLPLDLHITGKGMVADVKVETVKLSGGEDRLRIKFARPVEITPEVADAPTHLEIELYFEPEPGTSRHPLVDPAQRILIHGEHRMTTADWLANRDRDADERGYQTAVDILRDGGVVPPDIEEATAWKQMRDAPNDFHRAARICELTTIQGRPLLPGLEAWAMDLLLRHQIDQGTPFQAMADSARRQLILLCSMGEALDEEICAIAFSDAPGEGELYGFFEDVAKTPDEALAQAVAKRAYEAWPDSAVCLYQQALALLATGYVSDAKALLASRRELVRQAEFLGALNQRLRRVGPKAESPNRLKRLREALS